MFARSVIALVGLVLCATAAHGQSEKERPRTNAPLSNIADIRSLSDADARRGQPVRLQGTVVFVSQQPNLFILQDPTGTIAVTGTRDRNSRELLLGSSIELEGITASGRDGHHVTNRRREQIRVKLLGTDSTPIVQSATIEALNAGRFRDAFVEVTGIVRGARFEAGAGNQELFVATIASDRGRLTLLSPSWRGPRPPAQFVGATVRVRGVFNASYNDRLGIFQNRLLVPSHRDLVVESPATPPFKLTPQPIVSLRPADDEEELPDRVRIQGVVTLALAGKGAYVQDDHAAVWVENPDFDSLLAGTKIDVVGFPVWRDWHILLEDAVWRSQGKAPLPAPPEITADRALSEDFDGKLVQMQALLLEVSRLAEGTTLVLQSGSKVFLAHLADGGAAARWNPIPENSWVRITGVCVKNRGPHQSALPQLRRPVSFHLMIDSPDAVQIARAPSWWTAQRIATIFGGLAALAAASVAWILLLRRRVTAQTAQIREHLARETLYEERVRIARELHDSLEQDLTGIGMQLKATEKLLNDPERARQALRLASAMVRRSQAETHRAVWDLRDTESDHTDLVSMLRDAIGRLGSDHGPQIHLSTSGHVRDLPPVVENHLLRIAQEATTNALKHAHASRIEIHLEYARDLVTLTIADNGCGFDSIQSPSIQSGHFGLFGMRERAVKVNADFRIASRLGEGTEVRFAVPVDPPPPEPTTGRITTRLRPTLRSPAA